MRWRDLLLAIAFACVSALPATAGGRIALVIGETNYFNGQHPLENPARDAILVAQTLQADGFTLVGGGAYLNLSKAQLDRVVQMFAQAATNADVGLFYFSGHGMEVGGINYLLATDTDTYYTPGTVALQTLQADLVVKALDQAGVKLKIILLDACRTNPFIQQKGDAGGLAQMNAPAGTLIGFAAQPGATASEGMRGGNSPYASALAESMGTPGLDLFATLIETGLSVMKVTGGRQQPWIAASPIAGKFYFRQPAVVASAAPTTAISGAPPAIAPTPSPAPVSSGQSFSYIEQAYSLLSHNDLDGAADVLSHGIEMDRGSALPYSYLGFTRYLQGLSKPDPNDRLAYFRAGFNDLDRAIQLDPNYSPARRHRGNMILATHVALTRLGKPVNNIAWDALRDMGDAAAIDPTSMRNAAGLGMAQLFVQHYADAWQSFNRALALNPRYAAAYAGRCMAARFIGNMDSAQNDARAAAQRNSDLLGSQCLKTDPAGLWNVIRADL